MRNEFCTAIFYAIIFFVSYILISVYMDKVSEDRRELAKKDRELMDYFSMKEHNKQKSLLDHILVEEGL